MNPSSDPTSSLPPPAPSGPVPMPKVNVQGLSTVMPGTPEPVAAVPVLEVAAASAPVPAPAPVPVPMQVVVTAPNGPGPMVGGLGHVPMSATQSNNFFSKYWRKVGGGSLMISILIHVGILLVATLMVTTIVERDKAVDFLPGGGSKSGQEASQNMAKQVQMKKRSLMNKSTPMTKIVSTSQNAAIALPEMPTDNFDAPELSSLMGGGTMGSSGFGDSGAGGGFGNGLGSGGASGAMFKPIIMFGQNLQARKIAVIMDVSGSMTPHLTKVIKELDRVAAGSKVILYVGCGVASPKDGKRLDDDAMSTRSSTKVEEKSFESFWRKSHVKAPTPGMPAPTPDPKKKKDDPDPVPEQAVYDVLANRGETYFIKSQGIEYAWISLLVREVRDADALYWFSDFQDKVDDDQLEAVLKNLKRRKQKLFIHASGEGKSFAEVRDKLCIPSGGEVVVDPNKKK